jgi:hypothetical protein
VNIPPYPRTALVLTAGTWAAASWRNATPPFTGAEALADQDALPNAGKSPAYASITPIRSIWVRASSKSSDR